jgi:hypothetical protein
MLGCSIILRVDNPLAKTPLLKVGDMFCQTLVHPFTLSFFQLVEVAKGRKPML